MGYPKWKYSPEVFDPKALDGKGVIVADPDDEDALGPGWYDSPADFPKDTETFSVTQYAGDEQSTPTEPIRRKRGRPRKVRP